MTTKLNAKNVLILSATTTGLSVGFGIIGSFVLKELGYHPSYSLNTSLTWLAFHAPIISVAVSSLKTALGFRETPSITANSYDDTSRSILLNANGRTSHIFASLLPGSMPKAEEKRIATFTVTLDGGRHTITVPDLERFVFTCWRRQQQGKNGLSRQYWTRQHRPRLKTLEYNCRMAILLNRGLIIDRSERRSGRLVLSPYKILEELS